MISAALPSAIAASAPGAGCAQQEPSAILLHDFYERA
jgi:hypothetical protein